LKNLSLSGLTNISVIDLDSIDISNLNRQFLFRMKDVGNSKAVVAAEFIKNRVPGCIVTPYHAKIQDFDEDFYRQFRIIISGLDNIEARRWLNAMLVDMIKYDEDGDIIPESIIPMIDGGTEGFKGQARVIIPKITSCFECTLELFPPQKSFPLCTIRGLPLRPIFLFSF
jgi:NEDD8-activating enzyme E1